MIQLQLKMCLYFQKTVQEDIISKQKRYFTKSKRFKMFFSNRIISRWNNLPKAVVNLNTINAFKNSIDMIFNNIMYDTNINIYYDF